MKQLQVSAINTSGDNLPRQTLHSVYVNVNEGYNTDNYQIFVSTHYERNNKRRENELINISFPDMPTWTGTFEELKAKLFPDHVKGDKQYFLVDFCYGGQYKGEQKWHVVILADDVVKARDEFKQRYSYEEIYSIQQTAHSEPSKPQRYQ